MTIEIIEKACSKCKIVKPLDAFRTNQRATDGRKKQCKECWDVSIWARYATPEYVRAAGLWQRYGITVEQYNSLVDKQNGTCAICQQPPKKQFLYVDHCHETGRIRGLLCAGCNAALGVFKDSVEMLERAIGYLNSVEGEEREMRWGNKLLKPPHDRRPRGDDHYKNKQSPEERLRGEQHGMAFFTADQIREFRRRYDTGECTSVGMAREEGVSKPCMQAITSRRNWKHIE